MSDSNFRSAQHALLFEILLVVVSICSISAQLLPPSVTPWSTNGNISATSNSISSVFVDNISTLSTRTTATTTTTTTTAIASTLQPDISTTLYPPLIRKSTMRNYPWVIALIVICSLGIFVVFALEITILLRVYGTSLWHNWKSLWLGQILLFSIFCSYLTQFAFLPYPSKTTCYIIRFCVGVSYAMSFSVLVVKLLVIVSAAADQHPVFQVALFLALWAVQLVIDIQWLISNHAYMSRDLDIRDGYICTPGYTEHVQSLVYVMFLIVLCVFLSFLAHRRRNRGKYVHLDGLLIGISAGLTAAVWIVWILLGFLKNNKDWHDPCIAFGLVTTATILLVFMIIPKVYNLKRVRKALLNEADSSRHDSNNNTKKKNRDFLYQQNISNKGSYTNEIIADKLDELVPRPRENESISSDHPVTEVVTVHQTIPPVANGAVKQGKDEGWESDGNHVGESRMFYQIDSSQYDSEDTRISHRASGRYQQSGLKSHHPQWGTLNGPATGRRGSEGHFQRSSSLHSYHYNPPRGQAPPPYHEPGPDHRYRVAALYSARSDAAGARRWNLSEPDLTAYGYSSSSSTPSPVRHRSMESTASARRYQYTQEVQTNRMRAPVISSVISITH